MEITVHIDSKPYFKNMIGKEIKPSKRSTTYKVIGIQTPLFCDYEFTEAITVTKKGRIKKIKIKFEL